ncbi:hypothetical protein CFK39_07980 [Brachybacterium avium]|uniref:Alpha/beta hydrolase n=1 Tax=Brachybacterium avium TaxID=2017485 RepID=A0A220UCZ6_9MICO|nr:hypothetical protein [Brachybacterium avium]ASK65786.1 hypothetical protein CFK39_07980 [Brachybacterium avium]
MTFYGMDTEQVLGESDALEQAARRLEEVLGGLESSVHGVAWAGPDAEAFREQWDATHRRGESIVLPGLGERSRELQQHVEEQDDASSAGEDGWFQDAMDWLRDTGGDLVDGIRDGIGWLGDRVSDGKDWLGNRISDGIGWLGDRVQDGRDLVSNALDAIREFRWPRLTEVVVDGLTGLVRGTGDAIERLTGTDLKWADDGTGYADAPVAVTPEESGLVPPSDLAQIIANTNQTYGPEETGEVSMSVVGNPPTGVIVNIPGTEHWMPDAGDNPLDLTGNAEQAGSHGSSAGSQATADAIAQLYQQSGIPRKIPLMLNGHSQGGMIASSLAADQAFSSQFNVTNVMTYGSPVDNYDVSGSVNQLNIQHGGDLVPKIDAGGFALGPGGGGSEAATNVTLDSPGAHPFDIGTNHSSSEYQNSVETSLQDPNSQLSQYSQDASLQPFLTGDPENVQHYTSGLHRDN